MIELAARLILAGALLAAAAAKLARPGPTREALAIHGFREGVGRSTAWLFLVVAELGLGLGVAAGVENAAYAAGGLMLLFAATLVSALLRGQAGRPCACFGAGSELGPRALVRTLALGVALLALPSLATG